MRTGVGLTRRLVLVPSMILLSGPCLPLAAQGQNGVPGDEQSFSIRLGALTIGPAVVMTAARDTNILKTAAVANVASLEFVVSPQLNLVYPLGNYAFTSTGATEYTYTPNERSDKKYVSNNFVDANFASLGTVLRPRVRFERLSTYARSEIELGRKSQRNAQTIDAGLTWVPGRMSFQFDYNDLKTRFATDEFFRDVSLAEKLNFDFRTSSVSVGYELTPIFQLDASFDYTDNNFVLDPERNGRMHRTLGGVRFLAPGSIVGSARAGFRGYQSDVEADVRARTFTADSVLTYTRPGIQVAGLYYRDVGFSWDRTRALFLTQELAARYYQQLPKRLDFELDAQLTWVDYIRRSSGIPHPPGQLRRTLLGAMGVRLSRWTRVGVNVESDTSSGTEQWSGWRVASYLYYGSYRFRKLDRPLPR